LLHKRLFAILLPPSFEATGVEKSSSLVIFSKNIKLEVAIFFIESLLMFCVGFIFKETGTVV